MSLRIATLLETWVYTKYAAMYAWLVHMLQSNVSTNKNVVRHPGVPAIIENEFVAKVQRLQWCSIQLYLCQHCFWRYRRYRTVYSMSDSGIPAPRLPASIPANQPPIIGPSDARATRSQTRTTSGNTSPSGRSNHSLGSTKSLPRVASLVPLSTENSFNRCNKRTSPSTNSVSRSHHQQPKSIATSDDHWGKIRQLIREELTLFV